MGLLDKAEELEETTEEEEEEEEDLYAERPKKKVKKKKKGKKKKMALGKPKGKKKKKKKKKAAPEEEEEEDYYAAPPPRTKKVRKVKKKAKGEKKKGVAAKALKKRIDPRALPYAPLWKRYAAAAIDYFLVGVIFSGLLVAVIQDVVKDDRTIAPLYWIGLLAVISFMYFFVFEGIFGGRSIGKYIFGTEIINQYGEKPNILEGLLSSFGKTLFPILPIIPVVDMTGLFMGRSSRFYQRKLEHKVHLFVVDHTKFRGLDASMDEDDDYFGAMEEAETDEMPGGGEEETAPLETGEMGEERPVEDETPITEPA